MSTTYHLCMDVRGALLNWSNRQMKGVFQHDDGRPMSVVEAKLSLMEEIAKGRKVIPCSPCDNFDYQRGCLGHEAPDEPVATNDAATQSDSKEYRHSAGNSSLVTPRVHFASGARKPSLEDYDS